MLISEPSLTSGPCACAGRIDAASNTHVAAHRCSNGTTEPFEQVTAPSIAVSGQTVKPSAIFFANLSLDVRLAEPIAFDGRRRRPRPAAPGHLDDLSASIHDHRPAHRFDRARPPRQSPAR